MQLSQQSSFPSAMGGDASCTSGKVDRTNSIARVFAKVEVAGELAKDLTRPPANKLRAHLRAILPI